MTRFLTGVLLGLVLAGGALRLGQSMTTLRTQVPTRTAPTIVRVSTPTSCVPPNWDRREINGLVYYIQPLN